MTAAAAPVLHPLSAEILGVIDISGPDGTFNPQSLAHAVAMAQQIEGLVGRRIDAEHDRVLRHFLDRRSLWLTEEVVAFGRSGALIYSTEKALREIERRNPNLLAGGPLAFLNDIEPALWPSHFEMLLQGVSVEVLMEEGVELGGVLVFHNAHSSRPARKAPARDADEHSAFDAILGDCPVMREARDRAQRMVKSGVPVLLEGETGVGKELFARAIHGVRAPAGAFVPVNCGGLARDLVASEIFGYSKGAFTGADAAGRPGKLEAANGGLLCLDEIGEMPLEQQSYLLPMLEDGMVYRVGSHEGRKVDVRLVSMTNRDLLEEVSACRFRKDLYYRIATLRLRVPPLRERGDDIISLLEHFGSTASQRVCREPPRFTIAALDTLRANYWPGNVRELRNLVEVIVLMSPYGIVGVDDLPVEFRMAGTKPVAVANGSTDLRSVEQVAIAAAVHACGGNYTKAAKSLGIARSTLYLRVAEIDTMAGTRERYTPKI